MPDVEYFWDPACPWSWVTSRWMVNVLVEQPMEVDWRFISLRMINEGKDYEQDFPEGHKRVHQRGLELLRVAAAVRAELGGDLVLPFYTAVGTRIHVEKDPTSLDGPAGIRAVLRDLRYPVDLAGAADSEEYDDVIRADSEDALERCGGNIGTPVISFLPPDGPSFFGPVISRAPKGREAVELWNAVCTLGTNEFFSELKRSTRGRPEFD
ncbi:MAG TPA: hypothetical protein VHM89_08995 [Acidimicrobiales bacterium]|nr:hypothetical protein [Acidimicrobiales bacterium]